MSSVVKTATMVVSSAGNAKQSFVIPTLHNSVLIIVDGRAIHGMGNHSELPILITNFLLNLVRGGVEAGT